MLLLLITILTIIAANASLKVFFEMIRPGGALDRIFRWQKMLSHFYSKSNNSKWYFFLESALGGCERCTSFWFMPPWFVGYYITSNFAFHTWVTDSIHVNNSIGYWLVCCIVNVFWYCLFHSLGAWSGHLMLTKLFKKNEL